LQVFRESLAVVNSPPEKIDERFSLRGVSLIFVNENVGVTRDRIGRWTSSVGDRNAQILGRASRRRSGGCSNGFNRRFNKSASRIFDVGYRTRIETM
jgi:hypothetical protein